MVPQKKNSQKRRKGNKRELTRARIIAAAAQVIGETGFEHVTLEEVAVRAGMTRGAIYGNFADREDLLLAVVESAWKPIVPSPQASGSLRELMASLGEAVVAAAPARQAHAVGAASFQVYALTHPELRRRLTRWNTELYIRASGKLREQGPESEFPMPAGDFVRVLHALTEGLLLLRFLTPTLISNDLIRAAFRMLAGGPPIS